MPWGRTGRSVGSTATARGRLVVAALSCLGLAGCVSYAPLPVDAGAAQARLTARRLDGPDVTTALKSVGVSERPISDVERLAWTSVYYSPEVRAAYARWQVARAAAITAGARPNPQLDVSAERARSGAEAAPWTQGLSVGLAIETAGKRAARIAQAVADAERARFEFHDAAWAQRARVLDGMIGLDATTAPLEDTVRIQRARAVLMQRRLELGLSAAPQLTRLRLDQQSAETQLAEGLQRNAEARTAVAAALAVPVEAVQGVRASLSPMPVPSPDALPALGVQRLALLSRPDLLAALAAYDASEAALRLEVARQYPDVIVSPGLLWDAGVAKWTLAASLVVPLVDRNRGPIAEATARRAAAGAEVLRAQAVALSELDRARATYTAAFAGWQASRARVTQAERLQTSAERALRVGTGTRSDVLAAEFEARQAQVDAEHWRTETLRGLAAIESAQRHAIFAPPFDLERLDTFPLAEAVSHD